MWILSDEALAKLACPPSRVLDKRWALPHNNISINYIYHPIIEEPEKQLHRSRRIDYSSAFMCVEMKVRANKIQQKTGSIMKRVSSIASIQFLRLIQHRILSYTRVIIDLLWYLPHIRRRLYPESSLLCNSFGDSIIRAFTGFRLAVWTWFAFFFACSQCVHSFL